MTDPSSAGAGALLYKLGLTGLVGVAGGLIMAAVDPPSTRKELFLQGSASGIGSMVFGPAALHVSADYFPLINPTQIEWAVPVYFLVGALSWGIFGAIAQFRKLVAKYGAQKAADVAGLDSGDSK